MDLVVVAFILVAGIAAGLLIYRGMVGGSVRDAFAELPVASLASISAPGRYRLRGKVVAIGEAPVSEASSRPYVARDLRIHESDGASSGSTRPAQQVIDFLLEDGSDRVLVRGADATVAIDRDFEMPRTTLDQVPWVDALLRAGGYSNGSPSTCRIRVYEGVLGPGSRVGIVGYLDAPDTEARQLGAKFLVRAEGRTPVAVRSEEEVFSGR